MTWSAISKLAGITAALFGFWLLYRVLSRYDAGEIIAALEQLTAADLAQAALFAVVSFAALATGEFCAVRYAGYRIGFARVARTATAAIGIGHAVGLAALSSGAIRYRMHGRAGVTLAGLARIMLFAGLTVAAGMASIGGIALLARPQAIAPLVGLPAPQLRLAGAVLLGLVAAYLVLCCLRLGPLRIRGMALALPSPGLALGQIAAGAANYAAIAACLHACLRPFAEADYATAATLYVGADATALVGHVPGGWGVLEYVLTAALAQPQVITGILVFRTIYYLVPLVVGLAVFLQDEVADLRRRSSDHDGKHPPHSAAGLSR